MRLNTNIQEIIEYLVASEAVPSARVASNMKAHTLVIMATEWGMFDGNAVESYNEVYIDGININYYFHQS